MAVAVRKVRERGENQLALIDDLPESVRDKVKAKQVLTDLRSRDRNLVLAPNYHLVTTTNELLAVAEAMEQSGIVAVDTETRGKRWQNPKCKVVALNIFTPSSNTSHFIPVRMIHATRNFDDYEIADALGNALQSESIKKIGHTFKFDMHMIRETFGVEVGGFHFDALIAAIILNENEDHDLETLCFRYLKSPRWKNSFAAPFETWPLKIAQAYGCRDAEATHKLYEFQARMLEKPRLAELKSLVYDVEFPTMLEAYAAERHGVNFDSQYFEGEVKPTITANELSAQATVFASTGEINLNAPEQIASAMFDMLGLPRIEGDSTKEAVLSQLKKDGHALAGAVLDWRKWSTINKMFVKQLPKHVVNGRIHCSFNTCGTEHGRWSCKDPNLQQLPKRIGPMIRRAIIPGPGNVFVAMDFSQIELRLLAHFAGDPKLIDAFVQGTDIHLRVMHDMLGVSFDEYAANPDKVEFVAKRVLAKTINFGILYGMGPSKLSWKAGVSMEEAQRTRAAYFATYPGINRFINATHVSAYENGYVTTLLGRKRRLLPGIRSTDKGVAAMAERESVSAVISGSAADLAKVALLKHRDLIVENHWPYQLILQLHDEFIYEVPERWVSHHQDTMYQLADAMANAIPLRVPVEVKPEVLRRWGDKTKLEDDGFEDEE